MVIVVICFFVAKNSYDNALKKKLEMQAGKKSGREGAGAAASARDGDEIGSDYMGFGTDGR
ncbi:unnamed protein product [Heligmosomoides polygyrus]|uniref:Uncharacterized protein n=1 Tax=Heligmosomoides polygyrus TaxID=6339 RepID=A0A3P8IG37_HELPZ|nr:unnamed protein product [Heligmosomoides polygyrus]